jgi:hypothetical protein
MSKLKVVILATMIVWTGLELRQTAIAAQSSTSVMTKATHPRGVVTDVRSHSVSGRDSFALAKGCTLKRYRRPR